MPRSIDLDDKYGRLQAEYLRLLERLREIEEVLRRAGEKVPPRREKS